ncbi:hypothetical protein RRG08_064368 [Elysia crispata]|uniref:Uncharacterized protein n=1 Tax=Elysia crispata TaxID=231223 RepID=A0AAE1D2U1_9GAST|nr:hypothetical protein RRG08_064368 [Elysia crispata]
MISMIVLDTRTGDVPLQHNHDQYDCLGHRTRYVLVVLNTITYDCLGHKHGLRSTAQDFHDHDQYDCLGHKHGLHSTAQDFHNHDQYDCLGHKHGIQQPKNVTMVMLSPQVASKARATAAQCLPQR